MNIIEYESSLPAPANRGFLHRIRNGIRNLKPSRDGRAHIRDLLEAELIDALEGERHLEQLQRIATLADGEIRMQQYLLDQRGKLAALTAIRRMGYAATKGQKRVNTINDFIRQSDELLRRHPDLKDQVEEMQRQFFAEVGRDEEIG